jgi:hypothetical protein
MTDTQRINELEEALLLFSGLLAGEPTDVTDEEKLAVQTRLAALFERMRTGYCK